MPEKMVKATNDEGYVRWLEVQVKKGTRIPNPFEHYLSTLKWTKAAIVRSHVVAQEALDMLNHVLKELN